MEVIYIDSVFLLNFVIDYLLVLASAQVCGVRLRRVIFQRLLPVRPMLRPYICRVSVFSLPRF